MFREGNLVRLITEAGDADVMRVLADSYDSGTTYCAIGNDDGEITCDTGDLELVKEVQEELESKPQMPNIPSRCQEDVHQDVQLMFLQAIQYARGRGIDVEKITLEIEAKSYNDDNVDISFKASIGHYGVSVESDNLFRSIEVAVGRFQTDETLKPLSIPLYKDAAE